jgi:hypothetical protein
MSAIATHMAVGNCSFLPVSLPDCLLFQNLSSLVLWQIPNGWPTCTETHLPARYAHRIRVAWRLLAFLSLLNRSRSSEAVSHFESWSNGCRRKLPASVSECPSATSRCTTARIEPNVNLSNRFPSNRCEQCDVHVFCACFAAFETCIISTIGSAASSTLVRSGGSRVRVNPFVVSQKSISPRLLLGDLQVCSGTDTTLKCSA